MNLRIAELERAIETFKTEGGGAFSSKRSKKNNNGGGGGEDAADVKLRLANLFKEKWALAAAERSVQFLKTLPRQDYQPNPCLRIFCNTIMFPVVIPRDTFLVSKTNSPDLRGPDYATRTRFGAHGREGRAGYSLL